MATEPLLIKCRRACRFTTDAYDAEISDLIASGFADLAFADVETSEAENTDVAVGRAVITYVCYHYAEDREYDRLKAAYDEQKAQLQTRAHNHANDDDD